MLESRIRELRLVRGWTQADLAKRLQLSEKAIKNWERGISKPSVTNVVSLAKLFCVSADYLLGLDKRNPIYIDHLPEDEQLRVRLIIQAYCDMVLNQASSCEQTGRLHC